jgi:hypothetical protein
MICKYSSINLNYTNYNYIVIESLKSFVNIINTIIIIFNS